MIEITFGNLSKKTIQVFYAIKGFFFLLKFSYEQWGRWFEPKFFLMEESENTTALRGLWPMILMDGKNDNDNDNLFGKTVYRMRSIKTIYKMKTINTKLKA